MKKISVIAVGMFIVCGAYASAPNRTYDKKDVKPCEGAEYAHLSCTGVGAVVDGTVVEYNDKGQLLSEIPYRGGQRHGLAREYYEIQIPGDYPRRIKTETNYEYGKNLMVKTYYESGSIHLIMNHEKGSVQEYKEDGKLRTERTK